MLDLGWSELLVIGIVALIVVGPKDLPRMLRALGQYAAKAKSVAREFQRSMDEAARQADIDELREVKKDLDKDVSGLREQQYKMQREMSQSFTDKPGTKGSSKPKSGGEARTGGEAKAEAEPVEKAGTEPSPEPARSSAPAPDEAGPAPRPEPRKASGA